MVKNDMCLIRRPVQHCTNMDQGRTLEIFLKKYRDPLSKQRKHNYTVQSKVIVAQEVFT